MLESLHALSEHARTIERVNRTGWRWEEVRPRPVRRPRLRLRRRLIRLIARLTRVVAPRPAAPRAYPG